VLVFICKFRIVVKTLYPQPLHLIWEIYLGPSRSSNSSNTNWQHSILYCSWGFSGGLILTSCIYIWMKWAFIASYHKKSSFCLCIYCLSFIDSSVNMCCVFIYYFSHLIKEDYFLLVHIFACFSYIKMCCIFICLDTSILATSSMERREYLVAQKYNPVMVKKTVFCMWMMYHSTHYEYSARDSYLQPYVPYWFYGDYVPWLGPSIYRAGWCRSNLNFPTSTIFVYEIN
jgi:hypothetical protein